MRILAAALAATVATLALAGCGDDEPTYTAEQQESAEDFCGGEGQFVLGGMGIDKYDNPDGYDRCVQDAVKVTTCLAAANEASSPEVPDSCWGPDGSSIDPMDGIPSDDGT